MGLAAAPVGMWGLAWIMLVPVWSMVLGADPQRIGKSGWLRSSLLSREFVLPFVWGLGYNGFTLWWITGLHPLTWLGVPWLGSVAITLFCWLFITLWGSVPLGVWGWLTRRLAGSGRGVRRSLARVLIGTALWCGLEKLVSWTPLDWDSVAFTQSPGNRIILHLGQLSGPLLVAAAIVACNGLLAEAWIALAQRRDSATMRRLLGLNLALLVIVHLIGYELYNRSLEPRPQDALRVGVVQGNVPTRIKLTAAGIQRGISGYTNGYLSLVDQGVDAVLTPEGAFPTLWSDRTKDQNPFYQAVQQRGKVGWLGTFVLREQGFTQTLLTLLPDGTVFSGYNKVKLVPLGEYVPFQEVLGGLVSRLSPLDTSMIPGSSDQRFDTPFGRAIVSICYESAFAEHFRAQAASGGQFILTASNLDPYSEVLMAQHQALDLMRAIETDRWAARATNTGYSGFIDPHGIILWRSQPQSYQLHAETIQRRQTQTPYVRWGDWSTPLLLLGAGIVGFNTLRSRTPT